MREMTQQLSYSNSKTTRSYAEATSSLTWLDNSIRLWGGGVIYSFCSFLNPHLDMKVLLT